MRRPAALLIALLVVLALPGAATAKKVPTGPAGLAFYTPPSPLGGKKHGDIIRARRATGQAALKGAARTDLVLYRSESIKGKPVAVSGTVSIPKGKAPKSGWPVITYAHGTTGLADVCAPSRDATGTSVHPYNSYVYPLLTRWLKAGYAVVRTDYEGLGTPGVHPYLIGESEGRSTLDVVRAARELDTHLSKKVAIAGHSQGGHAALWAAHLAHSWTPELRIRATVAFAPASHLADQAKLLNTLTSPGGGISALVASIMRGLDTVRPDLGVPALLSDAAKPLYPQTLTQCQSDLAKSTSFGGLSPKGIFRDGANLAPEIAVIAKSDPEHLGISTPVRIEQGTSDTTVFPVFTGKLVDAYKAAKVPVSYRTYPNVTHGGVVTAAAQDATSFLKLKLGS
jgi:acetyl esterase/lipase